MRTKDMFLSFRGRMLRQTFWRYACVVWIAFILLFIVFERAFGHASTLLLYPPFFVVLLALITKRLHDRNKRGAWILLVLVPIAGPILLVAELGFLRGSAGPNRYGRDPSESYPDYQIVK
jgi:uncharacterized membrane protein YhaH (DUF805 family)